MKKVLIQVKRDVLVFTYSMNNRPSQNLHNTNIINTDELVFSLKYIESNKKIVANFVRELVHDLALRSVEIESVELAESVIDTLAKIDKIAVLSIRNMDTITFALSEAIVGNGNVEKVSCYSAPDFIIEYMDRNGVVLDSRSELFFTSSFMQSNSLSQYTKIYYKVALRVDSPMGEDDLTDFEAFCKINKYLKSIHFNVCDLQDIRSVIEVLVRNKKRNIKIMIHDNVTSEATIKELRLINRQNKFKNKIDIRLVYSKEYIRDNYVKQILFTTLLYTSVVALFIVGGAFSYITYNNYASEKNVDSIKYSISQVLKEASLPEGEEGEYGPTAINSLLEINGDTVGWLTVKGTNIDYPVVQAVDNDYYLNKNYNKEKDYNGWVFADYRNNIENLNRNTIIYAHNRYNSGVMFGTLSNTLDEEWLNDKSNHVITFNTLYDEMTFKVFSIYTVKKTSDYITTSFKSDNEFMDFVELIQGRSEYDFETVVKSTDKILTLSTCHEKDKRFVVHAILMTDE